MQQVSNARVRKSVHAVICTLLLAALPAPTIAQSGMLEEIIVTATKREQSLQDVPMAITAFSAEVIEEAGINNALDLAVVAPSLTITVNTQPFTAAFRIRGIGTSQSDVALEPSVGLFVDEVYLNRSGLGMSDLTDIERIEILQGPQGTLYGKNTNAGAISIFTKRPNLEEFEGYVETTVGDYNLQKLTASASGPVSDSLALRLSGTVHQHNGYMDNSAGKDLNDADDWNLIGKLLYEPSDQLRILVNANYVNRNANCCAADSVQSDSVNKALATSGLAIDKNNPYDHKIAVDVDNKFNNNSEGISMIADYDLSWGSFKSITAFGSANGGASYDPDRSQLDVMSYVNAKSKGDSASQELRFTSQANDNLDYQLGLFYFQSTTKSGDGNPFVILGEDFISQANQQDLSGLLPPGVPNIAFVAQPGDYISARTKLETHSIAAFGQTTWHINERWRATGGLRWTDEQKDADLRVAVDSTAISASLTGLSFLTSVTTPIDDDFSRSKSKVNWLASTSFDIFEDTMLFGRASTGSKSGGFNTVNGTPEEREFDDEDTTSYELGAKSTLLESRLRVNASLFFTQIDDYQFQQQLNTGIGTRVSNQAQVETAGLDLELQALPLPNLTLTAGLIYMSKYQITDGPNKGAELPFTAEYSGTVSATLMLPLADGAIYSRTDYSYMDDHLTTGSVNPTSKDLQDRTTLNTKLGWRNDHWNLSVWGKNLTNDIYAGLTAETFLVTGMDAYFLAPPRTYGATLRYDF